jgi:hypothetical protein
MNNVLKLVYDTWENNEPKPNGYVNNIALRPRLFWIPYDVIDVVLNNNYKIQNLKLEEADENSYYIINHQCSFEFVFGKKNWVLTPSVEEMVRTKNLKIIFLSEHESFDKIETHLANLRDLIIKKGLKEENFYVLNNNSNLNTFKNKLNTKINVFKTHWLTELIASAEYEKTQFVENKKFIFLLYNRTPKPHRIGLLILLKKLGLLTDYIIDWSLVYSIIGNPFNNTFMDKSFIDINSKEIRPLFKEFLNVNKLSYFETDKNWFEDCSLHNVVTHNELTSFEQSYIHIVTESYFDEVDIHITEKTYKPFCFFQIPIFLSNHNFVKKLREEHPDLYLFDDLINHDYDNEVDNNKRLILVLNEIQRLSEMRDTIQQYYVNNKEKFIQNQNCIKQYRNHNTTLNFFKSLIK